MGAMPAVLFVFDIQPVSTSILRDHQQFLDATGDQFFSLAQHRMGRSAGKTAAHIRNNAEFALVITAFGNLQVTVMAWRQRDCTCREQINIRVRLGWHGRMHRVQHLFVLMRPRNRQHLGVRASDIIGISTKTARDQHFAILAKRLTNRFKAFGLGTVKKPTGVDDNRIRAGVIRRDAITLGPQSRQNAFAVHQGFGTAKTDHTDTRLAGSTSFSNPGVCKIRAKAGRIGAHMRAIAEVG